jgi:hypothetical protein
MRSYPNHIPLPAAMIRKIVATTEPFAFDRLYSGWWTNVMQAGAKHNIAASEYRYLEALEGRFLI